MNGLTRTSNIGFLIVSILFTIADTIGIDRLDFEYVIHLIVVRWLGMTWPWPLG